MTSSAKRRWFYLISLAITIPGLIFILLTPFTDAGLQFTIDYTGGTKWEIRFEDPNVTPDQVEAVFAQQGLEAVAVTHRVRVHRDQDRAAGRLPRGRPVRRAVHVAPERVAGRQRRRQRQPRPAPARHRAPARRQRHRRPRARRRLRQRVARRLAAARRRRRRPRPATPRSRPRASSARSPRALQDELGPIAEQRSLTTIGAVVSSDLISQALILILVGSLGIMLWITYRFRDVKFGVTALVALLHDVIVVVGVFAILGTFFHVEIDALFVTAMLTVIGFSVHDTIVVFDRDPREQGPPRRRAVRRRSSTTRSCRPSAARS